MLGPVRPGYLVVDQGVDGPGVRDTEQGLGEAHEGHALVARQAVFGKKRLHQPRPGTGSHRLYIAHGTPNDAGPGVGAKGSCADQAVEEVVVVPALVLIPCRVEPCVELLHAGPSCSVPEIIGLGGQGFFLHARAE